MDNVHLARRCGNIKGDVDSLIDDLIREIEELEEEKERLNVVINDLNKEIENLM